MSKPLVERYEQVLAQDPASTVFVELAKALIERGDFPRAAEVCQLGLSHHPDSVVGRVLWGKALIQLGRPAEAMEQFDKAIAIDRENPYAYNLIGEVLLHKGLYRSALPLLKKAVALQPNDGRVRQWLEQTQRALEGGAPPPPPADATVNTRPARASKPPVPDEEDPFDAVASRRPLEEGGEKTATFHLPEDEEDGDPKTQEMSLPAAAENPFDSVAAYSPQPELLGGMTDTFDALAPTRKSEPTIIPSADLLREGGVEVSQPINGKLLADIPSALSEIPSEANTVAPPTPPPVPAGGHKSLLSDVPELVEPPPVVEEPKNPYTTQATEALAQEYELELRMKMAAQAAKGSFLQRHGMKLVLALVVGLVLAAFAATYAYTKAKNRGRDLADTLAEAKKSLAQDTAAGYRQGLQSLSHALEMDSGSPEVWALTGYAYAVLHAEHGGQELDKKNAVTALAQPGVSDRYPGLALAARYLLADASQRAKVKQEVLASKLEETEVEELAGRLLLAEDKGDEGWKRLSKAVELRPGNVRALVALGSYYLAYGDPDNALKVLGGAAAQLSPLHPERVVAAAEARLQLNLELAEALVEVQKMPTEGLEPQLVARRELVLGRLLSASGKHAEALEVLYEGSRRFSGQGYEFQMALGEAARAAGRLGDAQTAFDAALRLQPKSAEALEAVGRTLLARDRERELLKLNVESESRPMFLLRGIAHTRLKDWKRARVELNKTQVDGKFPPEAVVYLALIDGHEGDAGKAIELLEKVLSASKKARSEVHVALGQLYWKRGELPQAKKHFEQATKDPSDYEGACGLGRLLIALGLPEVAVTPLAMSVSRNDSHHESHEALQLAYATAGRYLDALPKAEQWVRAHPGSFSAQLAHALALYRNGKFQEADAASAKAVRLGGSKAEAHRLRAMVLFSVGETKKAFSSLEQANKLNPRDPETFCEIGHAFIRTGSPDKAQAAFGAALREDSKSFCGLVGALFAKLPAGGKSAAKDLEELAKKAPTAADKAFAESTRARVLLANGAWKDGRQSAEAAVQLTPFSGGAQLALGLVALKQKDEAVATEALEKAVQYEPASSPAQLALGDALARSRDQARLTKAVAAYEAFLSLGGSEADQARVKRVLPQLKKRVE